MEEEGIYAIVAVVFVDCTGYRASTGEGGYASVTFEDCIGYTGGGIYAILAEAFVDCIHYTGGGTMPLSPGRLLTVSDTMKGDLCFCCCRVC